MDKKIILPGEKIADGRINAPNTYSDGVATYAAVIGMVGSDGHYIPLENRYKATVNDVIIGFVTDVIHAGYRIDVNLPQEGFIPTRNIKINLQMGDFVICKVKSVNEVGDVDVGEVRRLPKGKIIDFPPAKVPRLIGRKSSMLFLLRDFAGGDIMVGNNGYVWISDKSNIPLLLKAIKQIEVKAHKSGLTDEIANLLSKETGKAYVREEFERAVEEAQQGEEYEQQ
ncbi:MAG: KH domain-containing protein [Candidatus Bilamarchaeum sp.]|jgi:exosome complex component RRP4